MYHRFTCNANCIGTPNPPSPADATEDLPNATTPSHAGLAPPQQVQGPDTAQSETTNSPAYTANSGSILALPPQENLPLFRRDRPNAGANQPRQFNLTELGRREFRQMLINVIRQHEQLRSRINRSHQHGHFTAADDRHPRSSSSAEVLLRNYTDSSTSPSPRLLNDSDIQMDDPSMRAIRFRVTGMQLEFSVRLTCASAFPDDFSRISECIICHEPFGGIEHLALSLRPVCGHIIGKSCLRQNLNSEAAMCLHCPMCRRSLTPLVDREFTASSRGEDDPAIDDPMVEIKVSRAIDVTARTVSRILETMADPEAGMLSLVMNLRVLN